MWATMPLSTNVSATDREWTMDNYAETMALMRICVHQRSFFIHRAAAVQTGKKSENHSNDGVKKNVDR